VLYSCDVEIATDTSGTFPLTCSNVGASDPDGNKLGSDCTDGMITVAASADATVVLGSVTGGAGDFESLDVTLQTGVQVASTQNEITFPPQASVAAGSDGKPICAVNSAIGKNGTFEFQPAGCTVASTCTGVLATISDTGDMSPIPGGSRLYTCQIAISATAANGTYPLPCANPSAQNPEGGSLVAACVDGSVIVGVQPTPTDTPTNTPTPTGQTGGTPTVTPTPNATNTSVVPPTPTRRLHFADSDSCQIIAAAEGRPAWVLLLPAALLLAARRRRR
jgi:MYXO-CTERM domain-containing protein